MHWKYTLHIVVLSDQGFSLALYIFIFVGMKQAASKKNRVGRPNKT